MEVVEKKTTTILPRDGFERETLIDFLRDENFERAEGSNVKTGAGHISVFINNQVFDFSNVGKNATKELAMFSDTKNKILVFERCIFVGGLHFSSFDCDRMFFKHCQFVDPDLPFKPTGLRSLCFSNCVIEQISFQKCLFEKPVEFLESKISEIKIDAVRCEQVQLQRLGYSDLCGLVVSQYCGGKISLPFEDKFGEITSDTFSVSYFQNAKQPILVS